MGALVAQADATFVGPEIDWFALSPLLVLLGVGLALLLTAALTPRWPRHLYAAVASLGAVAATVLCMVLWADVSDDGPQTLIRGTLALDHFGLFAAIAICIAVVLTCGVTTDQLGAQGEDAPEPYALYLMAAIGGIVMAAALDLVVLFLGLEILSLSLYVLAASNRRRAESQEAGLKYFVLGGFSSAFLLYGIALVYGSTGETLYTGVGAVLSAEVFLNGSGALLLAGAALLLVGLGFKVSAVPFHMWAPDVYQGAPSPVTGFMASAGKVAAFAALLRVLRTALATRADDWRPIIWVLAVLTLLVGALLAIVQANVKRMLAYSSITHAGFVLVAVEATGHVADPESVDGLSAAMLYLMIYVVLVIGTFAVVTLVARASDGNSDLAAFRGLARRRPGLALAVTVLLLAQAGVPFTSGFVSKFAVIEAAAVVDSYALALVAMIAAVIAAMLYLRIMISMWLADGDADAPRVQVSVSTGLVLAVSVGFTLLVGIFPDWLIEASEQVVTLAR
jgi:NADH-quinone oxidoreductase subunit N